MLLNRHGFSSRVAFAAWPYCYVPLKSYRDTARWSGDVTCGAALLVGDWREVVSKYRQDGDTVRDVLTFVPFGFDRYLLSEDKRTKL